MATTTSNFLVTIPLSCSPRWSYLRDHRDVLGGIMNRFCPSCLYRLSYKTGMLTVITESADAFGLSEELELGTHLINAFNYDEFIVKSCASKKHAFAIEMNAIQRNGDRAKPVIGDENIINWFSRHAEKNGFVADIRKIETKTIKAVRGTPIYIADIRGTLEICDTQKFLDAMVCGMGRSKHFGCGLLTLDTIAV